MELKLKCGAVTVVDDDCPHLSYDWQLLSTGHVAAFTTDPFSREPIVVLLDRLVLPVEPGWIVSHINGRKADNRRENLEPSQYTYRGKGPHRTSVSGILGVQHIPTVCGKRPWRAQICSGNHNYHLGSFATKEEAIAIRRAGELAFFGEVRCATTTPA